MGKLSSLMGAVFAVLSFNAIAADAPETITVTSSAFDHHGTVPEEYSAYSDNKSIDKLIRKNLITVDMASSLVNDHINVNDLIKKLIKVAELLYLEKDIILENDK